MKKVVIAVAVIAAVGVGGISYANHVASKEVRAEIDKQLALVSEQTGTTLKYGDVSASVISNSVEITQMEVLSPEGDNVANIESIVVKGYETDKISPNSTLDIKNLQFNKDFVAQFPNETNTMLASASYDLHSSLDYDEQSGDSDVVVNLAAKDIVSFHVDMGLANTKTLMDVSFAAQQQASDKPLSEDQLLQQQMLIMEAAQQIEPRYINIALNNQGELEALLESELSKQGMSVEQMQMMVEQQLQQAPVTEDIAQAISDFAKGLNSFSVSAKLPEGQTMMEINQQIMMLMGQPEKLAKLINLEVKGD